MHHTVTVDMSRINKGVLSYCRGHGNPVDWPGPAPSARTEQRLIRCDQRAAACVPFTHGCMASALGPQDVQPDFHDHDSTS